VPIFISYASADAGTANAVVGKLEQAGLACWIAPRDVTPGALYADEIVRAINDSSLVVLLLSANSVASAHVGKELERASSKGRRIIALRMDGAALPPAFEYFLSESQWIEMGAGGLDPAAAKLTDAVQRHLGSATARTSAGRPMPAPSLAAQPEAPAGRKGLKAVAVAAVAVLLAAAGLYWGFNRQAATPAPSAAGASLAVLPFVDLSPEKDQEYFSDGLAEELLNELAQIKELRVAGRTSSFSFKGRNEDLREIGRKLGVGNILEGSVRKAGKQLRITAKLVDATDGTQRWSKSFDRELSDVFAVQAEIAMAVSDALSVTLDVGEMSRANGGTTNVEAYDRFLQAQALWYQGGELPAFQRVSQLYREVLALDPDFSRAWNGLYRSVEQEIVRGADPAVGGREMQRCVERLQALSPDAWWTRSILAADMIRQRKWAAADAAVSAALASSPGPDIALTYGLFLQRVGRSNEAVQYIRRMTEAEPLSRSLSLSLQIALTQAGQMDEAQAEYERSKRLEGTNVLADAFALWRMWGRKPIDKAAVDAHLRAMQAAGIPFVTGVNPDNWADPPAAIAALRRAYAQSPLPGPAFAAFADHYGERDIVLRTLRKSLVENNGPQLFSLWLFNESGWRSDPEFKAILRDLGLVEYYRSSGRWPDHCRPQGSDEFECH
jgi:TolB-like protein